MPLEQIEVEIKARTAMVTENIIAIGWMLLGVKERLEHGQFADWLRDRVNYSQSTANNFMRIAREVQYTPALVSFPHTKVLALLDVPSEEREQFIAENKVDELSTRKLKELIKERDAAKKEAEIQRRAADRSAELADQYSQKFYEVKDQLNAAQVRLDNPPQPEKVEVRIEVPPPDYERIKAALEAEKRRAEAAEAYAEQQEAAYLEERQKSQRLHMRQINENGPLSTDPYSPQELGKAVQAFMGVMGSIPHMTAYFATMPQERLHEYRTFVETLEAWVAGAKATIQYNALRIVSDAVIVE